MNAKPNGRPGLAVQWPSPWWLAIALYFPAACLAHLQFSLWLVRRRSAVLPGGKEYGFAYADAVPWLAGAAAVALAWHLWRQSRKDTRRPWRMMLYWLAWCACASLVDRYLTYSVNEYVHYPQYGLLAWLMARALDPGRQRWRVAKVIFWTTLLGMADESLQYLWITRSYSNYLDFNDFFVNLLAAAAGAMVYYGNAQRPSVVKRPPARSLEKTVTLILATATGLGIANGRIVLPPGPETPVPHPIYQAGDGQWRFALQDRPNHLGAWLPGKRRPQFYVLTPWAGLTAMLLAGGLFAHYPGGTKRKSETHPPKQAESVIEST